MNAPPERPRHTIRIFRHDPKQPIQPGVNPIQIDVTSIEHQTTMPRRERAAAAAVRENVGATAAIGHSPGGDMVATISAPGSMQPSVSPAPPTLSDAAVRELLQNPTIMRELQRLANHQAK